MHDRANTPVRPYKQTRGALSIYILPWILNFKVKYKYLSPPLFIEEVARAKRCDGGVKTPTTVGADPRVCPANTSNAIPGGIRPLKGVVKSIYKTNLLSKQHVVFNWLCLQWFYALLYCKMACWWFCILVLTSINNVRSYDFVLLPKIISNNIGVDPYFIFCVNLSSWPYLNENIKRCSRWA